MAQKYRHKATSVSLINYHFVWIPRRRKKVLGGKIAERLSFLIKEGATVNRCVKKSGGMLQIASRVTNDR